MPSSIAFLEAFNAKQMSTADIAASFVPSEKYSELAGAWNALLIGPRGSGKTTLLKMLQLKALRAWQHKEAEEYRQGIKYTGIFVPADIAWGGMVDQLGRGKLDDEAQTLLSEAVFCTNVFQAVVDAMIDRIATRAGGYRVANAKESTLREALKEISALWKLTPNFFALESLKLSLNQRLMLVKEKATQLALSKKYHVDHVLNELPFSTIDVIAAAESALEVFDRAIDDPEGRWCLLLDEFELAPAHLQKTIVGQFRSANKKLLFKIALAPCTPHTVENFGSMSSANKSDDYRRVELWYPDRMSAMKFCESIFHSRMAAFEHLDHLSPEDVFGRSTYSLIDEDDQGETRPSYGRGAEWKKVFSSLAERDASFAEYLSRREIDPDTLDPSPKTRNGNTIRKIAPLVAIREAYLRAEGKPVRSRKNVSTVYSGWHAISAISEGNPRWLIGILNMIASRFSHNSPLPISPAIQSQQISNVTETFKSMLKTVATNQPIGIKTKLPIYKLIEDIGQYFFDRVVKDKFMEEPPLAFRVDGQIDPDIENALRIALNHGAIVYMPDSGDSRDFSSLKGKKFRIAYLLAPTLKLPLRATKEISLSSILLKNKQSELAGSASSRIPLVPKQMSFQKTFFERDMPDD